VPRNLHDGRHGGRPSGRRDTLRRVQIALQSAPAAEKEEAAKTRRGERFSNLAFSAPWRFNPIPVCVFAPLREVLFLDAVEDQPRRAKPTACCSLLISSSVSWRKLLGWRRPSETGPRRVRTSFSTRQPDVLHTYGAPADSCPRRWRFRAMLCAHCVRPRARRRVGVRPSSSGTPWRRRSIPSPVIAPFTFTR
jgi:hypothetical protein